MYLSSPKTKIATTDAVLRPVVFIILSLIFAIPSFFIYSKHKELQQNRLFISKNTPFKVIAVVYAIIYFIGILKAAARFDLFVSTELFPNADMTIFLSGMLIACVVISFTDIGALSRSATVFVGIVILSTVFVMFSLADNVRLLNFTPVFENGLPRFFEDSLLFTMQATEIGTIIMFLPEIKGDVKKNFVKWSIFSGLSFSLILFFVIGSLGEFADTQLFPTYASVTIATLGLIERIDALETAVWILCVIGKISFFFLVVIKSLCYTFKVSKYVVGGICCGATIIFITFISSNIERFYFLSSEILTAVLFLMSVLILPLIILIIMKRVKPCEKQEDSI